MKLIAIMLSVIYLVANQAPNENFYQGLMAFTDKDSTASQRVNHINNSILILTLNQVEYNTYFSLIMKESLTSFGNGDMLTLNILVASQTNSPIIHKITVQFMIMKDLPFVYSIKINLTEAESSKQITSTKGIQYDGTVSLAAFPIGFSNVKLSAYIYFYAPKHSKNYTIYTKLPLTYKEWIIVNLVILDYTPDNLANCQGSYLTSISRVNSNSTPFYFERRANLKYIFGVETMYQYSGKISYISSELTVFVTGKGSFDFSAIVLNVDCKMDLQSNKQKYSFSCRVYVILTVVFAISTSFLLIGILLFACWKKFRPLYRYSSNSSAKMYAKISSKNMEQEKEFNAKQMEEPIESADLQDVITDTRLTHMASERQQYQRPKIIYPVYSKPCDFPTCINNPNVILTPATYHLRRICDDCYINRIVSGNN